MKIALVHDDLIQYGGAERLFEAMREVWPKADIYTSMTTWEGSPKDRNPQTSFMQKLPFKEKLYRHYFPLYPLAFESFNLSEYDLVISSSTRFAHGVITPPETLHICYMNSPGRMFWEPQTYFENFPHSFKFLLNPFLSYFRLWDYAAAQRVDRFIANAKTPQARIKKYYGRDSHVIYPFVDLKRFSKDAASFPARLAFGDSVAGGPNPSGSGPSTRRVSPATASPDRFFRDDYFLIVSRLTAWKKIDMAIEACNQLKLPLKIIGKGPDFQRLKKFAGLPAGRQVPTVELLGRLTDEEVVSYYQSCRALIFPQKEDFGITPLEAQAAGKPVIAFKAGGALETVIDGKTGEFFYPQTAEALTKVLKDFGPEKYQSEDCCQQAERFGKTRFQTELKGFVEKAYEKHTKVLQFG